MKLKPLAAKPISAHYHHGDLREELLKTALKVIEKEGLALLSLRDLARRLKVSHAAPYRHFATKDDLVNEIGIRAFTKFRDILANAWTAQKATEDFPTRFRRMGLAYLDFAHQEEAAYKLMFSADFRALRKNHELSKVSAESFEVLHEAVRLGMRIRHLKGTSSLAIALRIWANMHGLATLRMTGCFSVLEQEGMSEKTFLSSCIEF